MKTLLPLAILACLASSLQAQMPPIPGSVSSVTFALTFTSSTPGTVVKDPGTGKPVKGPNAGPTYENEWEITNEARKTSEETYEYVSKLKTTKFGNKELLLHLIDREIIPEIGIAPHLAGWAIVRANASVTHLGGRTSQGDSRLYAVHKAEEIFVDLSNYIDFGDGPDFAENGTYKVVTKTTQVGTEDEASTTVFTSLFNWKQTQHVEMDFNGLSNAPSVAVGENTWFANLQGVATLGHRLATVGTAKTPVIVDAAGKLSAISGPGPFTEEEGERSVVEGNILFSPGKAEADLRSYPNIFPFEF